MDDKEFWRQWWGNEPTELELIDMAREANQHIVTDINNKRATYLPKIFKEAKDWNYIKTSLLNKAGIK